MKDLCVTLICSKWALFSSTTLRLKEPFGQTKEKSIQTYFKLPRRKISLCAPTWYTNLNSVSLIFNSGFLMTTLNVFCLWQYRHSSLLYITECVDYNIVTCVKDFNLAVGLILTESLTAVRAVLKSWNKYKFTHHVLDLHLVKTYIELQQLHDLTLKTINCKLFCQSVNLYTHFKQNVFV